MIYTKAKEIAANYQYLVGQELPDGLGFVHAVCAAPDDEEQGMKFMEDFSSGGLEAAVKGLDANHDGEWNVRAIVEQRSFHGVDIRAIPGVAVYIPKN